MDRKFAGQLTTFIGQSGLPVRRVASLAGIPYQTIYNWIKGTQPRWYDGLPGDMRRLGEALNLSAGEITLLLQLAGCLSLRSDGITRQSALQTELFSVQEGYMENVMRVPNGWFVAGEAPECYEMGIDPVVRYEGHSCITIKARPDPRQFGTLLQVIQAVAYRGKRLRFSAAVRAMDVSHWAGLWMRVDGLDGKMLAFDNMMNRPITGTRDWAQYAVVLDIPEDAQAILFGILLEQQGQIWMGNVHVDEVNQDVPTTSPANIPPPLHPVNLGFDD